MTNPVQIPDAVDGTPREPLIKEAPILADQAVNETRVQGELPINANPIDMAAVLEAISSINIHDEANDYEWRGDGDYTPSEQEKVLLEDFGHGLVSVIEDAIRALSAEPAKQQTCEKSQTEHLRISQLENALTSILFEDSDKTEQQRLIDRVKARTVLEGAEPAQGEQWRPTHRHVKRGTDYQLIGTGKMQAEAWFDYANGASADMQEVAIYRGDDDQLWARPILEFNDGRFEPIPAAPTPEAGR